MPASLPDAAFPVRCLQGDIGDPADAMPPGTDIVFHLAAVVSAQAEADYELGLRVNLHGALAVAEACRHLVGPAPSRRGWYSRPRSRRSAADRTPSWPTTRASFPPTATAQRRPPRNCCWRTPRGAASSIGLAPPSHRHHPAGPAEPRRLQFLLRHPARAAARAARRSAGRRRFRRLGREPAPGGGLADPRRDHDTAADWVSTAASIRPA